MKFKKKNQVSSEQLSKYSKDLYPIIDSVVASLGFKLQKISFVNENQISYLRITISHTECKISLNDCEITSRKVEQEIETHNLIPFSYTLEVQSPGSDSDSTHEANYSFTLKDLNLVVKS